MNTATLPTNAGTSSPWDDVVAIYRRICLLRGRGRTDEAERLQACELVRALGNAMPADGETEAYTTFRDGLFRLEEDRVNHALVLAELLAPLLMERLGQAADGFQPNPVRRLTPIRSSGSPLATESEDIANMIDSMLEQQLSAGRAHR